jgi:hypothetical protein
MAGILHSRLTSETLSGLPDWSVTEPSSESKLELEYPHGNPLTINCGKESSSEESSESVSKPPATAYGPLRKGFSVSSLCHDQSNTESSSKLLDTLPQLASPNDLPGSISSHIVSVNSTGPPVHMGPDAVDSPSDSSLRQDIWCVLGTCGWGKLACGAFGGLDVGPVGWNYLDLISHSLLKSCRVLGSPEESSPDGLGAGPLSSNLSSGKITGTGTAKP